MKHLPSVSPVAKGRACVARFMTNSGGASHCEYGIKNVALGHKAWQLDNTRVALTIVGWLNRECLCWGGEAFIVITWGALFFRTLVLVAAKSIGDVVVGLGNAINAVCYSNQAGIERHLILSVLYCAIVSCGPPWE